MEATNTISGVTTEKAFGTDVMDKLAGRAMRQGYIGCDRNYYAAVNVSDMVKKMSSIIWEFLCQRMLTCPLTDSDIEEALTNLVKLRILQVERRLPKNVQARDIPVPDFFRPFLSKLARFDDPLRNLEIDLYWDVELTPLEEGESIEERMVTVTKEELDELAKVCRVLKMNKIGVTDGLPRELTTQSDELFRIAETQEGELLVAGPDVDEVSLLIRGIIRVLFLRSVFGEARSRYVSVEDLRPAIEAIATSALPIV